MFLSGRSSLTKSAGHLMTCTKKVCYPTLSDPPFAWMVCFELGWFCFSWKLSFLIGCGSVVLMVLRSIISINADRCLFYLFLLLSFSDFKTYFPYFKMRLSTFLRAFFFSPLYQSGKTDNCWLKQEIFLGNTNSEDLYCTLSSSLLFFFDFSKWCF